MTAEKVLPVQWFSSPITEHEVMVAPARASLEPLFCLELSVVLKSAHHLCSVFREQTLNLSVCGESVNRPGLFTLGC